MPKFTKTLATLNTDQLLTPMDDFKINVPASYTVPALRALVKTHMEANPDLMRDPDYAPLFTKRARNTYLAQNPGLPSPTPSSWHGINPGSDGDSGSEEDSRASSPGAAPSHRGSPEADPRDLERETKLQLLHVLGGEDLDKLLEALLNRGSAQSTATADSGDAANAALAAHRSPKRHPGFTASDAAHLIPPNILSDL
ncbi:hypothetical protein B0H10DRAFT_1952750 [Mycena sp. CBHHK59/15]|nr:hypothetical protein B0H10DRAFT_1952750 [Mycena sp. CBHHK59/15]